VKRAYKSPFLLLINTNNIMQDFVVRKQVEIRSAIKNVWHALTDPELTQQYFFGCRVDSNWIVGSPITFKRKILLIFPFELKGTIIKMDRGRLLQYTLKNKDSKSESNVTIELYEEGGRTIVSVTDDVGDTDNDAEDRYERSVKGWDKVLSGLKRVTESKLNS
jgi:uncharacterized protein YndB with AHSA1/START domain